MLQLWLKMNTVRPSFAPSEDTQPPRPSLRPSDGASRPGPSSSSNDEAGQPRPSSWVGGVAASPRPSSSNDVVPRPSFSTSAAARPSRRLQLLSVRCACRGRGENRCTRRVPAPWVRQGCLHCIDCRDDDCCCNCINCCDVSSRSSSERSRTPPTERATVSEPEAEPAPSSNS